MLISKQIAYEVIKTLYQENPEKKGESQIVNRIINTTKTPIRLHITLTI